ncbi:MAG: hypothetical protein J0L80_16390 [Chitinophagales bacterium]|nr:hypothetical protein [Chitinophagales bacterium]
MKALLAIISQLPETVSEEALADYFRKVTASTPSVADREMVSYILFELANKQWHNYEKLQAPLLGEVDAFVSKLLQGETSLNVIQDLSGVIGMLGLTQSYEVFRNLITTEQTEDVMMEILGTITEYGDDVSNPYK